MRLVLVAVLSLSGFQVVLQAQQPKPAGEYADFANFVRYADANAALALPAPGVQRVVFMGDSITESWARRFDADFPGKPYVGRGISGQTTPQMLLRFTADVVHLKPSAVIPELAADTYVHPNAAGYRVMAPLAEQAIAKAQPAP